MDTSGRLASTVDLLLQGGVLELTTREGSGLADQPVTDPAWPLLLEVFVHPAPPHAAYTAYRQTAERPLHRAVAATLERERGTGRLFAADGDLLVLTPGSLLVQPRGPSPLPRLDLTTLSQATLQVLTGLAATTDLAPPPALDRAPFDDRVAELCRRGLLAPPPGELDWGDLRRPAPLCLRFGHSRGTAIDRVYLGRFLDEVRPDIRGRTLEIGGKRQNRALYRLPDAVDYRTLDLEPAGDQVDMVGDAHDRSLVAAGSLDTVIAFNVFEHCREPWRVAANLHHWLRDGGRALVAVPNAQRLHRVPEDYWRPSPAAVRWMFAPFRDVRLRVFGSALTATAALMGAAAEELTAEELDASHPDYPVLTCAVAQK